MLPKECCLGGTWSATIDGAGAGDVAGEGQEMLPKNCCHRGAERSAIQVHGRPEGEQGGVNAPPGFGHWFENLVKILTFCVTILTFGQNTNICSP